MRYLALLTATTLATTLGLLACTPVHAEEEPRVRADWTLSDIRTDGTTLHPDELQAVTLVCGVEDPREIEILRRPGSSTYGTFLASEALPDYGTYQCAVFVTDTAGRESALSLAVPYTYKPPGVAPPAAPVLLQVSPPG